MLRRIAGDDDRAAVAAGCVAFGSPGAVGCGAGSPAAAAGSGVIGWSAGGGLRQCLRSAARMQNDEQHLRQAARRGASAANGFRRLLSPFEPSALSIQARFHTPMEALPFWCCQSLSRCQAARNLLGDGCGLANDEFDARHIRMRLLRPT